MSQKPASDVFSFFNEIGIINQLSSTRFEQKLPAGLRLSQFGVLNHLVRVGEGKSPLQLARAFQLTKGAMTNTLGILEKNAHIEIRPNPDDGRSKLVFLTEKGRQTRDQAISELEEEFHLFSDKIDVESLSEALPILRNVREVLDRYRDNH